MPAPMNWLRRHPLLASNVIVLGPTVALTAGLWHTCSGVWSVVPWLIAWLASINVTTFLAYAVDKRQAERDGRRVPELALFLFAFLGGSVGAYSAMQLFRHKTIKGSFRIGFWLIVALQVALMLWIAKATWTE